MIKDPWKSSSVRMALDGKSFIDSKVIHIHTRNEAVRFLESYGYDLNDAEDKNELQAIRSEAIELIQNELLLPNELIPSSVLDEIDVCNLLMMASGHTNKRDAAWVGSILRVMHTLAHSHSYLNDLYHEIIRTQILNRFDKVIRTKDFKTFIGPIPLHQFEFRKAKTRWSAALKLMHKAENVAADIFDWVGIRIVTEYRADAMELLAYLRNEHVIAFSNIKPSRSRNTLINLDWVDKMSAVGVSSQQLRADIQDAKYPYEQEQLNKNPFSEISYQSIQLTCRQRIKIRQASGNRLSFFFPFELQIIDRVSYQRTREGLASHSEYKKRQKLAVRRRILPFLKNKNK